MRKVRILVAIEHGSIGCGACRVPLLRNFDAEVIGVAA